MKKEVWFWKRKASFRQLRGIRLLRNRTMAESSFLFLRMKIIDKLKFDQLDQSLWC